MTALILGVLFALQIQGPDLERLDGFYCATDRYLAYETLLNESPGVHLLRVLSLDAPADARPELTIEIAAEPSRRIRCEAAAVTLQGEMTTSHVRLDLRRWTAISDTNSQGERSTARWQTSRLWGTGAWTTGTVQRVPLRRFDNGGRTTLEIARVSMGGPHCQSEVGARIVWLDRDGLQTQSHAIFLRHADCQRAGLKPVPQLDDCSPQPGRVLHTFHGRVKADDSYSHAIPPFRIDLRPEGHFGWTIVVRPIDEDRDITSMIPMHGRTGREIQPEDVTATRWLWREFHFHPAMRKAIHYSDDAQTMLVDDLRVRAYGRGRLTIDRYSLGKDEKGQPRFDWIEFSGCVSWPR
jgi:hypothetical protein